MTHSWQYSATGFTSEQATPRDRIARGTVGCIRELLPPQKMTEVRSLGRRLGDEVMLRMTNWWHVVPGVITKLNRDVSPATYEVEIDASGGEKETVKDVTDDRIGETNENDIVVVKIMEWSKGVVAAVHDDGTYDIRLRGADTGADTGAEGGEGGPAGAAASGADGGASSAAANGSEDDSDDDAQIGSKEFGVARSLIISGTEHEKGDGRSNPSNLQQSQPDESGAPLPELAEGAAVHAYYTRCGGLEKGETASPAKVARRLPNGTYDLVYRDALRVPSEWLKEALKEGCEISVSVTSSGSWCDDESDTGTITRVNKGYSYSYGGPWKSSSYLVETDGNQSKCTVQESELAREFFNAADNPDGSGSKQVVMVEDPDSIDYYNKPWIACEVDCAHTAEM